MISFQHAELRRQRKTNRIVAHYRHGPSRTQADYTKVCGSILESWKNIVGSQGELELKAVFVLGGIVAVSEWGFMFPPAGGDAKWLKAHMNEFKQLAENGDQDFKDLIDDVQSRRLMSG